MKQPPPPASTPAALAHLRQALTQAILAQDMPRATFLLRDIPPAGDPQLDQMAARLYTATQNWSAAAAVLGRMNPADAQVRIKLNLARNLDALSRHRPGAYHAIVHTPPAGVHQLHQLPSGQLSIIRQEEGKPNVLLSPGSDPKAAADQALQTVHEVWRQGQSIGLAGVGDGYFLKKLADNHPMLQLGKRQVIHLFEPQPEVLVHAMMIHDWTGQHGPIQDPRFQWHVGEHWRTDYQKRMLQDDLYLAPPQVVARQSGQDFGLQELLDETSKKGDQINDELGRQLNAYYNELSDDTLAAVMGDAPPRPPRVLLMTSRYTTVLQHEARRIAQTFTEMGWETRLVIEPQSHHTLLAHGMRKAVLDYLPDLFFTLDHLRHEQGGIIPARLPYCCWVQDLLSNITSEKAGRKVDDRQWVLTFCQPLLTGRYAYPPGRCIDVPIMLASTPTLPESWETDGPDLAYVSNLSDDAPAMVSKTLEAAALVDRGVLDACCQKMLKYYQAGGSLPSKTDMGELLADILNSHFDKHGSKAPRQQAILQLIDKLWNPLNIGLYRQQGLRWVANIAKEEKLTLALYGQGWERHAEFAPFARGVIQPGQPLQELVRSTRINLNLEPYPCVTHVRMLDGLTAGGFYLVRHHPVNALLPQLTAFIQVHAPESQTDAQALTAVAPEQQAELRKLIAGNASVSYDHPPDVVAQMRAYQRANVLPPAGPLLPQLEEISFTDEATCRQRIKSFIPQPSIRRQIYMEQRDAVLARLTLRQGLSRVIDQIQRCMDAAPTPAAAEASPASATR